MGKRNIQNRNNIKIIESSFVNGIFLFQKWLLEIISIRKCEYQTRVWGNGFNTYYINERVDWAEDNDSKLNYYSM